MGIFSKFKEVFANNEYAKKQNPEAENIIKAKTSQEYADYTDKAVKSVETMEEYVQDIGKLNESDLESILKKATKTKEMLNTIKESIDDPIKSPDDQNNAEATPLARAEELVNKIEAELNARQGKGEQIKSDNLEDFSKAKELKELNQEIDTLIETYKENGEEDKVNAILERIKKAKTKAMEMDKTTVISELDRKEREVKTINKDREDVKKAA